MIGTALMAMMPVAPLPWVVIAPSAVISMAPGAPWPEVEAKIAEPPLVAVDPLLIAFDLIVILPPPLGPAVLTA